MTRRTFASNGTSATRAIQAHVALGIARELTGGRRNRVFVYDAYLDVLNEGGQPL